MKMHYLDKGEKGTTFYLVLNRLEKLFGIRYKTLPQEYQEGVGYIIKLKRLWFKYNLPVLTLDESQKPNPK